MTDKEIEKLSAPFREKRVTHLFMARLKNGISMSSIATGDDMYEFLQVLVEQNPVMLEIMKDVIESREKHKPSLPTTQYLN